MRVGDGIRTPASICCAPSWSGTRLQIDAYHENTQDKAHFQGHYYSDKAPGLVFLAVPFALIARPALRMAGVDPESPRGEVALSYVVSAGAVALPTALAGVCLFFLGLRFGGGPCGVGRRLERW